MPEIEIRLMETKDFEETAKMIIEFNNEILGSLGFYYNLPHFCEELKEYVGTTFIGVKEGKIIGVIGGKFFKIPFVENKAYVEAIWFVRPEYRTLGIKLMAKLESWCKEQGVKYILASRMNEYKAESFDKLYRRLGFVPYEVNYIKDLSKEVSDVKVSV